MSRTALAPDRAREYETIYILRADVDKETADKLTSRLVDSLKNEKGLLTQVELWGRRRLAYDIDGQRRGVYVYFKYLGRGNVVSELERQLKLADSVLRYQTVLLRENVLLAAEPTEEAPLDIDFDLSGQVDEPDLTRERELGLDAPFYDRGGRGRRDDRDRRGDSDDDDHGGDWTRPKPGDVKPGEKAADAKSADAKPADSTPSDAKPADAKPADAKPTKEG